MKHSHLTSESIDLLHLDGLHTEAAVRHDVAAWLPKLAPGGILLMHDVNVRTRDFGVWKAWEELKTRGRSYTFMQGTGLGVWQKPPSTRNLAPPTEDLLGQNESTIAQLTRYHSDRTAELQAKIAQQWRDGSIRKTAVGTQTSIQVFHTHDGMHREEDSVFARIGHGNWKGVSLPLPAGAGAAPLRIDFYSAFTIIDVSLIRMTCGTTQKFIAELPNEFDQIKIAGDAGADFHIRSICNSRLPVWIRSSISPLSRSARRTIRSRWKCGYGFIRRLETLSGSNRFLRGEGRRDGEAGPSR